MEYHAVANMFPLMDGEDFDSLVEDIREHGQLEPVLVSEGKIIDGRNRDRACNVLGIPTKTVEWDKLGSVVDLVVSRNFHRRHLSTTQRAMFAVKLKEQYQLDAQRQAAKNPVSDEIDQRYKYTTGNLNEKAAKAAGTSTFPVKLASQVVRHGTPSLVKAMDGNSPIAVANAAAVATMLPPEEQEALVAAGPEAVNEKGKALLQSRKDSPTGIYDPSTPEPLASKGVVAVGRYMDARIEHWAKQSEDYAEKVFAELSGVRLALCGR